MTELRPDQRATDPTTATSTELLERALGANAIVGLVAGAVLVAAPEWVNDTLDVSLTTPFRLFGLFLFGHTAILGYVLKRGPLLKFGRLNLSAIAPYPLLMIAAAFVVEPTNGKLLVLADGAVVAAVAAANWLGLRRAG